MFNKKACLIFFLSAFSIFNLQADEVIIPPGNTTEEGFESVFKSYYSDLPSETISIQDLKLKHTFNTAKIPMANGSEMVVGYSIKGFSGGKVSYFAGFDANRVNYRLRATNRVYGNRSLRSFGCLGNLSGLSLEQYGLGKPNLSKPLSFDSSLLPAGTIAVFQDKANLRCENAKPVVHYPDGLKLVFGLPDVNSSDLKWELEMMEDKDGNTIDFRSLPNVYLNDVEVNFIKNTNGDLKEITVNEGNKSYTTDFVYNNKKELSSVVDPENRVTKFEHTGAFTGAHTSIKKITFPSGLAVEYTYQGYLEGSRNSLTVTGKTISGPDIETRRFLYTLTKPELNYPGLSGHRSVAHEYNVQGEKGFTYVNYIHGMDYLASVYKKEVYLGPISTGFVLRSRWEEGELLAKNEIQWEKYKASNLGCIKQLNSPYYTFVGLCSQIRKLKEYKSYKMDNGFDTYSTYYLAYNSYGAVTKIKNIFSNNHTLPSRRIDELSFSGSNKFTKFTYQHNKDAWLLNNRNKTEVSAQDSNYITTNEFTLDSTNLNVIREYSFGLLQKSYSYFSTGNSRGAIESITLNAKRLTSNSNRKTQFSSDYRGGKPYKTTLFHPNSEALIHTIQNSNIFGKVTESTDANGVKTRYKYDSLGRLLAVDLENDTNHGYTWSDTLYSYDDEQNTLTAEKCTLDSTLSYCTNGVKFRDTEYYDSLMRIKLKKLEDIQNSADENSVRYQRYKYDRFGNTLFISNFSNSQLEITGTTNSYDIFGRIKTEAKSGLGEKKYSYLTNNKVKYTDAKNNQTTTTYQSFSSPKYERILKIASPENVTTTSNIDVVGLTHAITQTGPNQYGNSISITESRYYDSNRQLCLITRPDVGNTIYKHNALGMLVWSKAGVDNTQCINSAPSQSTFYTYDNLGGIKLVDYPDTFGDVSYERDNNGNVKTLTAGNVIHRYEYNSQNLLEEEQLFVGSELPLMLNYSYNALQHKSQIGYPDGTIVNFTPNGFGAPTEAQAYKSGNVDLSFAKSASYYANGTLSSFTYGNGVKHQTTLYADSLLPKQLKDTGPAGSNIPSTVMALTYDYDNNANVTSIIDSQNSAYSLTNLQYDDLDRLTSTTGGSGIGSSEMRYDGFGNITYYKNKGKTLNYTYDYTKNRLSKVTGISGRYSSLAYDTRGNITHNGAYALNFNRANQLTTAKGNSYIYDGYNRRVKQTDDNGTSYSMYSQDGVLLYRENGDTVTGNGTNYIYLGKKLIAKYGEVTPQTVSESRQHSRPFGETIETPKDDVGYTGHKFDTDLGLSYMQARYYDPVIGRFYSNDPLGYRDMYSFNRYTYGNNNPYKYIDPNGLNSSDILSGFQHWGEMWVIAGESVSGSIPNKVTFNPTRNNVRSIASNTSLVLAGLSVTPCSAICGGASLAIDLGLSADNLAHDEYGEAFLTAMPGVAGETIGRSYKRLNIVDPEKAAQIGATAGILTGQTINKSKEKPTSRAAEPKFFVIQMPSRAEKYRTWRRNRGSTGK